MAVVSSMATLPPSCQALISDALYVQHETASLDIRPRSILQHKSGGAVHIRRRRYMQNTYHATTSTWLNCPTVHDHPPPCNNLPTQQTINHARRTATACLVLGLRCRQQVDQQTANVDHKHAHNREGLKHTVGALMARCNRCDSAPCQL